MQFTPVYFLKLTLKGMILVEKKDRVKFTRSCGNESTLDLMKHVCHGVLEDNQCFLQVFEPFPG